MKKVSQAMLDGLAQLKGKTRCVLYNPKTDCGCAWGAALVGFGTPKSHLRDRAYALDTMPGYFEIKKADAILYEQCHISLITLSDGYSLLEENGMPIEDIAGILAAEGL